MVPFADSALNQLCQPLVVKLAHHFYRKHVNMQQQRALLFSRTESKMRKIHFKDTYYTSEWTCIKKQMIPQNPLRVLPTAMSTMHQCIRKITWINDIQCRTFLLRILNPCHVFKITQIHSVWWVHFYLCDTTNVYLESAISGYFRFVESTK